jgi:ABC-type dipeptide/oligopeptide/nickel transport system ATPase component
MEGKIVNIGKKLDIVNVPKRNYTPFYILSQPGGDILIVRDADEFSRLKRAMHQSQINCNKPVIGGGFNPRSPEEIKWVNNG